jgi:hypothetical protein
MLYLRSTAKGVRASAATWIPNSQSARLESVLTTCVERLNSTKLSLARAAERDPRFAGQIRSEKRSRACGK